MKKFHIFVLSVLVVGSSMAAALGQQVNANVTNDGYKVVQWWNVSTIDTDPTDCTEKVKDIRDALTSFNIPVSAGFSYVVVCDPKAWFKLKNSTRYRHVNTTTGMTDFANYLVYLNTFAKSAGDLRDTVAHEIGHMLCKCDDEYEADQKKCTVLAGRAIAMR